jgi:hypothetical protein
MEALKMTLRCAENCNGALAFLGCTRQGLIKRSKVTTGSSINCLINI